MDALAVRVNRKGQVTIPVALRRKYGIKEGIRVDIEDLGSGILRIAPKSKGLVDATPEGAY